MCFLHNKFLDQNSISLHDHQQHAVRCSKVYTKFSQRAIGNHRGDFTEKATIKLGLEEYR